MNSDRKVKNTTNHSTAFYMETLFLASIFVILILVLVQVFAFAIHMSDNARMLTGAVQLAENAAEAVAASDSREKLLLFLDEGGNAQINHNGVVCEYDRDMKPQPGGDIQMEVTWEPGENGIVDSRITVFSEDVEAPVYIMSTAVYVKEAAS